MAEINARTGQEYYCGKVEDISLICKVLNLDGGRLQQVTNDVIYSYMDMVEQMIDGYLAEYYFTPIRPYNIKMPDGHNELQFPGRLRRAAQYWAAGLLLTSEFQQLDTNSNEVANNYIEDARKEIHQIVTFNQRIPGQRTKSSWGKTMSPNMQPGLQAELLN